MQTARQLRWRSLSAGICLLAVVLLYAPLACASWSSYEASCCTSDQCPIKDHHHQKALESSSHHMDCDHEMPGMTSCSMSCCQNADRPITASVVFVLPAAVTVSAPARFTSATELAKPLDFPRLIEPISPPPRVAVAAV